MEGLVDLYDNVTKQNKELSLHGELVELTVRDIPDDEGVAVGEDRMLVSPVNGFPSPKERRKTLSKIMTRMYMFLHDLNWAGFDQYTSDLVNRFPNDYDVKTVLAIYKADRLKNSGDIQGAVAMFSEIESLLAQAKSIECLCVRYLTTKAFTLHFIGDQCQSLSLQGQAVQMSVLQLPSNPTAYNMTIYALHCCLHRVDSRGQSLIPTEDEWLKAESYYRIGCEQHLNWVQDLEEDTKIPESVCSSFFLFSFVRYIFSLVRSCVAGGFVYFYKHKTTDEKLQKAINCIERVKTKEDILSTRTKFEFALVQCDYFLRRADISATSKQDKANWYRKAKQFAHKALSVTRRLMDPQHAVFNRTFVESRLKFIRSKLRIEVGNGVYVTENLSDVSKSSKLSHMGSFKESPAFFQKEDSPTKDFLEDLGHRHSHFGRGSERHVASCPECSLRHTTPKESEIFELNLDERRSETVYINPEEVYNAPDSTEQLSHDSQRNMYIGNLESSDSTSFETVAQPRGVSERDWTPDRARSTRSIYADKGDTMKVCGRLAIGQKSVAYNEQSALSPILEVHSSASELNSSGEGTDLEDEIAIFKRN